MEIHHCVYKENISERGGGLPEGGADFTNLQGILYFRVFYISIIAYMTIYQSVCICNTYLLFDYFTFNCSVGCDLKMLKNRKLWIKETKSMPFIFSVHKCCFGLQYLYKRLKCLLYFFFKFAMTYKYLKYSKKNYQTNFFLLLH